MKWLITGGAGFIGCNVASRLMKKRHQTVVLDNLSRQGSVINLEWLEGQGKFDFVRGDVRNADEVARVFRDHPDTEVVLHLAGQVAVTSSLANPREDFEVNALGTFNVCEAVRIHAPEAILLYASTNKVYGALDSIHTIEAPMRYEAPRLPNGVSESQPLDLHSPYGCSKGAADQYVIDYSRIYGLKTVCFRQSCIYGPHQFGVEDQGWVAWFAIQSVLGRPLTIYGNGKQVRDVLMVDDLVDCYFQAVKNIERASGRAYNIGGGPENALSLREMIQLLSAFLNRRIAHTFADSRPGDQRIFVCDVSRAAQELEWQPKISPVQGIKRLLEWVIETHDPLAAAAAF